MMHYSIYGESDTGRVRAHNEDSIDWYLDSDGHTVLAVLADGVGGTTGGEVASQLAVEAVRSKTLELMRDATGCQPQSLLQQAIAEANHIVFEGRQQTPELAQMATTLVAGLACDDRLVIAHIGDSRCYRLRGDEFVALTRDDTLTEQMVEEGVITAEQKEGSGFNHILTRSLGSQDQVEAHIRQLDTQPGDVYLFCSDGLSGMLDDDAIHHILRGAESASRASDELIRQANAAGGDDNISVLILECSQ